MVPTMVAAPVPPSGLSGVLAESIPATNTRRNHAFRSTLKR